MMTSEKISIWAERWGITFNPDKTESLLFSRQIDSEMLHPDLYFNNLVIKNVSSHKHLGLFFNSHANWSDHISYIYEKAYKRINILRMLKYKVDRKTLELIYTTFIRPILEYADIVWANCTERECSILESIQIEAIHIITGLRRGTSHAALYTESGLIPLVKRRHLHQNIHFFKILNNKCPSYVSESILPFINNNTDHYPLRYIRLFDVPLARTQQYSSSFFPKIMSEWNNPSCLFPSMTSIHAIKKSFLPQPLTDNECPCTYTFKYYGNRKVNIILNQLRNSVSNLNSDLFNSHLVDSPACNCGHPVEDSTHFFLH